MFSRPTPSIKKFEMTVTWKRGMDGDRNGKGRRNAMCQILLQAKGYRYCADTAVMRGKKRVFFSAEKIQLKYMCFKINVSGSHHEMISVSTIIELLSIQIYIIQIIYMNLEAFESNISMGVRRKKRNEETERERERW